MKIRVATACSERWESFPARGAGRHCDSCDRTVVDLSVLTRRAAEAWLGARRGERVCGRLLVDARGEPVFRPERRRLPVLGSVAFAGMLAACVPDEPPPVAEATTAQPAEPVDTLEGFSGSLAMGRMMPMAPEDPSIAASPTPTPTVIEPIPSPEQIALTHEKHERHRARRPPAYASHPLRTAPMMGDIAF